MSEKKHTKKKKSILPKSLMLMGISALLFPLLLLITVGVQLVKLYANMGGGEHTYLVLLPIALVMSVFLTQIFYGLRLQKHQHNGDITKLQKKWAIVLLLFGLIAVFIGLPWAVYGMIAPIYPLLNTIK